jgi:hypothetical protein
MSNSLVVPPVVALGRDLPSHLVNLVTDRAARCAKLIDIDRCA